MEGKGLFTQHNGRSRIYKGVYVNDKKESFGVFKWPDERKYEGGWKN